MAYNLKEYCIYNTYVFVEDLEIIQNRLKAFLLYNNETFILLAAILNYTYMKFYDLPIYDFDHDNLYWSFKNFFFVFFKIAKCCSERLYLILSLKLMAILWSLYFHDHVGCSLNFVVLAIY